MKQLTVIITSFVYILLLVGCTDDEVIQQDLTRTPVHRFNPGKYLANQFP